MTKLLITGATGFVGRRLCEVLRERGIDFAAAVRQGAAERQIAVGAITAATDWSAALAGCDTVIHLAARVHVMNEESASPIAEFRAMNVNATLNLARQAAAAGVKRFVFVSSVKVNGEMTTERPVAAADIPAPSDPYGQSKLEAELALQQFAPASGLELVIVRPPLVYGPGVKANFLNLIKLVKWGIPLPFGRIRNRRSMVALDNLVDLLIVCSAHPDAAGRTFMVSDGDDLSIADLVRMIAAAMGKKIVFLPVPPSLLSGSARMLGKAAVADRLLGSLQVDIADTKDTLKWEPVISSRAAIDQTVAHFLATSSRN
jgi:nucleoside-diphosphate-sugar epimerase